MNPLVRAIGKVLRLVGISSPEDQLPKAKSAADPPSWRDVPTRSQRDAPGGQGEAPGGTDKKDRPAGS
jgi:hypothetical protein